MTKLIFYITIVLSTICYSSQGGNQAPAPTQEILKYGSYENCEGKDIANYTLLVKITMDQFCQKNDDSLDSSDSLIACNSKMRSVNTLKPLAKASFPAGAYTQAEKLWLSVSGSLEGKYVYEKTVYLATAYLKKCSSILGYSYVTSKTTVLSIADKLDLSVLLSPTGAFDVFQKTASTVCQGVAYCF